MFLRCCRCGGNLYPEVLEDGSLIYTCLLCARQYDVKGCLLRRAPSAEEVSTKKGSGFHNRRVK